MEKVLRLIPVDSRPEGYNPLAKKNLDPRWIARLGQSGKDCYDAIVKMDAKALGRGVNLGLKCWDTLLSLSMRGGVLAVDLMDLATAYQKQYLSATYSGPGGGYLIVISEEPVPGAFKVNIRTAGK